MRIFVRDNNVDQALRVLKKKMQREGIFREMKQRRAYEKPSERKTREKSEAVRRARKLAPEHQGRDRMAGAVERRQHIGDQQRHQHDQGQDFKGAQNGLFCLVVKAGGDWVRALLTASQFQPFSSSFMTHPAPSRN